MWQVNLLDYRSDVYTNTGNDGIIAKVFDILQVDKGVFVEFGAWDGKHLSNCRRLFEKGWAGIFIEANKDRYGQLVDNYKDTDIICVNAMVGVTGQFDDIVTNANIQHVDFCSIDIDGLDVEVFETFEKCLPDVVCIEGGQMLHPYHERILPKVAMHNIQQSLSVMVDVFEQKGYKALCSYQDTFFIKQQFHNLFDVSDSIMDLYLDGLKAHARRIPWIVRTIKAHGLSNSILNDILANCNFRKYGYDKRKKWAVVEYELVCSYIDSIRGQ
jgi:hypothetical protein